MGLDATAFSRLTKIDNPGADEEDGEDGGVRFYDNTDFPGRIAGIEARAVYSYERTEECYSGGYGGYNHWREALAKLAGYPAVLVDRHGFGTSEMRHDGGAQVAGAGPFYELIWFTDCDGTIGPVVSAKLAKDFANFQVQADAHPDPIFRTRYAAWRVGFELAADGGAVKFA